MSMCECVCVCKCACVCMPVCLWAYLRNCQPSLLRPESPKFADEWQVGASKELTLNFQVPG